MEFDVAGTVIRVNQPDRPGLMAEVARRFAGGEGFALATLNLDHLVKLGRSEPFRRAYAAQDFITADGRPVVWLSRLAGRPVGLAPGSELIEPLCRIAAARGVPVALLGATEATLAAAGAVLAARIPGLRIVASIAPPFGLDPEGAAADAQIAAVAASGARLCFLALGAPRQEILAARAARMVPGCGFVSVGAGLDFLAGTQRRAPGPVRALALEWAWRMLGDPRRLAGRYLACALILPGLAIGALGMRWSAPADPGGPGRG